MTASSKIRNIALSQLVLSPTNVRKTPATAAEDMALEASIRAHGIKQNLVVHPAPIDGKGIYEVDAGGRRLKILQKLADEGAIDADHPVPCLIDSADDALETSLVENTIRAAMHPADEFVAMAALIEASAMIDEVAQRFGTSERHVRAAPAPRQARAGIARRLPQGGHQPRCGDRLHPRRRPCRAARGVEPAQGQFLHPGLHGEAAPDRERGAA